MLLFYNKLENSYDSDKEKNSKSDKINFTSKQLQKGKIYSSNGNKNKISINILAEVCRSWSIKTKLTCFNDLLNKLNKLCDINYTIEPKSNKGGFFIYYSFDKDKNMEKPSDDNLIFSNRDAKCGKNTIINKSLNASSIEDIYKFLSKLLWRF